MKTSLRNIEFSSFESVRRCGVYALMWKREVVYIGRSVDLEARIRTHVGKFWNKPGRKTKFDSVFIHECSPPEAKIKERELIAELLPRFNCCGVKKLRARYNGIKVKYERITS